VPDVQVFSRQKIDFLREKRNLSEIEAAEALGMRKMLSASIAVENGRVSLAVEVVDIATGVLEATERVDGPQADLLDLETELALRVRTARGVRPSNDELRDIVAQRHDATVDAYRLLTETLGGPPPTRPPDPPPPGPPVHPGTSWLDLNATAWAQTPDR